MALKRVANFRQNIKIILWGTEIGQLFWNDRTESSYFFFSPDYFRQPYDLTPITCPKNSGEARLAIMGDKVKESSLLEPSYSQRKNLRI